MAIWNSMRVLPVVTASLMLGACAQSLDVPKIDLLSSTKPSSEAKETTEADPKAELLRATEYWGKEYGKNPRDLNAALSYARNLKALGQKSQALAVLQQAAVFHGNDRKLASEYGRLALEFDQVSLADQMLTLADDPTNPDWRIISARGTVLAKQGKYSEAVPYYERALTLANDQPSILNNLALAYTMSGEAARAEALLRRAAQSNGSDRKVRQNLALVLGLQGKSAESRQVAMQDAPSETVVADSETLRRMVGTSPKPASSAAAPVQLAAAPPAKRPVAATTPWQVQIAETSEPAPESALPLRPAAD